MHGELRVEVGAERAVGNARADERGEGRAEPLRDDLRLDGDQLLGV